MVHRNRGPRVDDVTGGTRAVVVVGRAVLLVTGGARFIIAVTVVFLPPVVVGVAGRAGHRIVVVGRRVAPPAIGEVRVIEGHLLPIDRRMAIRALPRVVILRRIRRQVTGGAIVEILVMVKGVVGPVLGVRVACVAWSAGIRRLLVLLRQ